MTADNTDLVVIEPHAVTLWGTDNTDIIAEKVFALAKFVNTIVERGDLVTNISGRSYVRVEGWQAAGIGVGLAAHVELVEPTGPMDSRGQWPGFIAHGSLRSSNGDVIATAEASCERDEPTWRSRPNYALRSMVQTRLTGKLYRQVLGFVLTVAGYEPTPAEEMPGYGEVGISIGASADGPPIGEPAPARSAPTRPVTPRATRAPSASTSMPAAVRDDAPTAPGSTWADMVHYVMEQHGVEGEEERPMVLAWARHAGLIADGVEDFMEAVRTIAGEVAQRRWGPDQIIGTANDFFAARQAMRDPGPRELPEA